MSEDISVEAKLALANIALKHVKAQLDRTVDRMNLLEKERGYLIQEKDYWKKQVKEFDKLYEDIWKVRLGNGGPYRESFNVN